MDARDHFDRIMSSLHDAMLDDAQWPAASRLIDEACEIGGNALVVGKGRSQADGEIFLSRFCYRGERQPERERRYFDHYYRWTSAFPAWRSCPTAVWYPSRSSIRNTNGRPRPPTTRPCPAAATSRA